MTELNKEQRKYLEDQLIIAMLKLKQIEMQLAGDLPYYEREGK